MRLKRADYSLESEKNEKLPLSVRAWDRNCNRCFNDQINEVGFGVNEKSVSDRSSQTNSYIHHHLTVRVYCNPDLAGFMIRLCKLPISGLR